MSHILRKSGFSYAKDNGSEEPVDQIYIISTFSVYCLDLRLFVRKPVFGVSDQILHKLGCTTNWAVQLQKMA